MQILLATKNIKKASRLSWLLSGIKYDPVSVHELDKRAAITCQLPISNEILFKSFEKEAVYISSRWSKIVDYPVIAYAGGVIVPFLKTRDLESLVEDVLRNVKNVSKEEIALELMNNDNGNRKIIWEEAVAVSIKGKTKFWKARSSGIIMRKTFDGNNGWWITRIWFSSKYKKPYCELTAKQLQQTNIRNFLREKITQFFIDYQKSLQT